MMSAHPLPEIERPMLQLIEHRDWLLEQLVEFVAASPATCWPAFVSAGGTLAMIERDDLRLILAACREAHPDRLHVFKLAYRALEYAGLVDPTIQHFRRGVLWSHASLVSCWCAQYPNHVDDVRDITTQIIDANTRLIDARDSINYARARLSGEA